jgi:hypothetical protein
MRHPTLLRRYAAWGLALGVIVACGTENNTPPTSYGYPGDDAGGSVGANSEPAGSSSSGGDLGGSSSGVSGGSSGAGPSSSGGGNSNSSGAGGNSSGSGVCPSSCSSNADCSSCPLPTSTAKNCCVMGICAMMTSCPTIRDSGRDGS